MLRTALRFYGLPYCTRSKGFTPWTGPWLGKLNAATGDSPMQPRQ